MYKQQSYDTPTEEFFQPSEGRIRDDTPYTEKFFDEYLGEHDFLDEHAIEEFKKSKYGKLYYNINAALVHTFEEIAENKEIFLKIHKNEVKDNEELYTYGKKQDVEIVIIKGCNIEKIKTKVTNGQVNVCIHIPYKNNDFQKYSLTYIVKYMGLGDDYDDVNLKNVNFDEEGKHKYTIFSYQSGHKTTKFAGIIKTGQKIKRHLCISIPFLEFIKFTDLKTNKKLIETLLISENSFHKTKTSLYRPETKKGDPRIWIFF